MNTALNQFKENIERVRSLHSIYNSLNNQTTNIVDISDILRAELVLLVSAFDWYIHEIVRVGMLEVFQGTRDETISFKKFDISLEYVREALTNPESFDWLEREIINRHSWKSFQHSDKVAEAFRLISDLKLWEELGTRLNETPEDLKGQVNLIVDRRNKIAHEADMDPSYPGSRWPIDAHMVEESIAVIDQIVNTIHDTLEI